MKTTTYKYTIENEIKLKTKQKLLIIFLISSYHLIPQSLYFLHLIHLLQC